jgi:hypothetical protein
MNLLLKGKEKLERYSVSTCKAHAHNNVPSAYRQTDRWIDENKPKNSVASIQAQLAQLTQPDHR